MLALATTIQYRRLPIFNIYIKRPWPKEIASSVLEQDMVDGMPTEIGCLSYSEQVDEHTGRIDCSSFKGQRWHYYGIQYSATIEHCAFP